MALSDGAYGICELVITTQLFEYLYNSIIFNFNRKLRTTIHRIGKNDYINRKRMQLSFYSILKIVRKLLWDLLDDLE